MECKKVPTYIFLNKNNEEVERKTGILSKKNFFLTLKNIITINGG